MISILDDVRVV